MPGTLVGGPCPCVRVGRFTDVVVVGTVVGDVAVEPAVVGELDAGPAVVGETPGMDAAGVPSPGEPVAVFGCDPRPATPCAAPESEAAGAATVVVLDDLDATDELDDRAGMRTSRLPAPRAIFSAPVAIRPTSARCAPGNESEPVNPPTSSNTYKPASTTRVRPTARRRVRLRPVSSTNTGPEAARAPSAATRSTAIFEFIGPNRS